MNNHKKIFKLNGIHLDITNDSDNSLEYATTGYNPHEKELEKYEWDIFEGIIDGDKWMSTFSMSLSFNKIHSRND